MKNYTKHSRTQNKKSQENENPDKYNLWRERERKWDEKFTTSEVVLKRDVLFGAPLSGV